MDSETTDTKASLLERVFLLNAQSRQDCVGDIGRSAWRQQSEQSSTRTRTWDRANRASLCA